MRSSDLRNALQTLALSASILLAPSAALAQKPYSVLTQWTVGGEGGWDYLTSDS